MTDATKANESSSAPLDDDLALDGRDADNVKGGKTAPPPKGGSNSK
jgi:hypothetical protein